MAALSARQAFELIRSGRELPEGTVLDADDAEMKVLNAAHDFYVSPRVSNETGDPPEPWAS